VGGAISEGVEAGGFCFQKGGDMADELMATKEGEGTNEAGSL
jgi:hypothetical protein